MKYPSDPTPAQREAEKLRMDLTAALSSERRLREALEETQASLRRITPLAEDTIVVFPHTIKANRVVIAQAAAALTTPAACPDLVLVGREEWERIQKQVTEAGLKGGVE